MTRPTQLTLEERPGSERHWQRVPIEEAELALYSPLFEPAQASDHFATLRDTVAWEQHRVRIFGREVESPRLCAWYGDPGASYQYSGLRLTATGWPAAVACIRARVQELCKTRFNSVLLNYYRDGLDAMGWHSDDEHELGHLPAIASVSLGAARRFKLKPRRRSSSWAAVELELPHNSLLLMSGPTQANWRHALPRTRRPVTGRINLTFRYVHAAGMLR